MNKQQLRHAMDCLQVFNDEAFLKYSKGQKEHGGNMWQKTGMLSNAYMEIIDQLFYLSVVGQQIEAAKKAIEDGHIPLAYEILSGLIKQTEE